MKKIKKFKIKNGGISMNEIKCTIVEKLGILSENDKGWKREVNIISWNDKMPKYDIREWAPDNERMGKGMTFTMDEIKVLTQILKEKELELKGLSNEQREETKSTIKKDRDDELPF